MADYIDYSLQPLVNKLRARYPGVRIVEATLCEMDGAPQQIIRFQAPLPALESAGLIEPKMLKGINDNRVGNTTAIGDGFILCKSLDDESRDGCWDLMMMTEGYPRERPRIATTEAKRLLRKIAKGIKKAA